jgi:RNA polymerase sigma factor for flagellar operon FliA
VLPGRATLELGEGRSAHVVGPSLPESGPGGPRETEPDSVQGAPDVDSLWERYRANPGDDTRNALVEAYHDFAGEVTRRFAARLPRSVDRGDMVTAGHVGLMNAIAGFDPERGVRFESYCELRVKGALLDELRTQDWLPRPWRQRVEHQKRTVEALRAREGREPTDEEIAAEMDLSVDLYQQLFSVGLPGTPLGSMALDGSDQDVMLALEIIPDPSAVDPDEGLTRAELLTLVTQRLTEGEYRILYLRYWEGMAMREIGELTELSESRVCKIHSRLIERLQERLRVPPDRD